LRLSVGLEDAGDLIADLRNSFDLFFVKTNDYSLRLENC
jgi:hypothetical protein